MCRSPRVRTLSGLPEESANLVGCSCAVPSGGHVTDPTPLCPRCWLIRASGSVCRTASAETRGCSHAQLMGMVQLEPKASATESVWFTYCVPFPIVLKQLAVWQSLLRLSSYGAACAARGALTFVCSPILDSKLASPPLVQTSLPSLRSQCIGTILVWRKVAVLRFSPVPKETHLLKAFYYIVIVSVSSLYKAGHENLTNGSERAKILAIHSLCKEVHK